MARRHDETNVDNPKRKHRQQAGDLDWVFCALAAIWQYFCCIMASFFVRLVFAVKLPVEDHVQANRVTVYAVGLRASFGNVLCVKQTELVPMRANTGSMFVQEKSTSKEVLQH